MNAELIDRVDVGGVSDEEMKSNTEYALLCIKPGLYAGWFKVSDHSA